MSTPDQQDELRAVPDLLEQVRAARHRVASRGGRPFDPVASAAEVGAVARLLHTLARLQWRYPDDGAAWDAWREATVAWREAIDGAYPPGFWDAYARLRDRDPAGLETAIAFLEADPWFFRSGYVKAVLIRYINRLGLLPGQRAAARGRARGGGPPRSAGVPSLLSAGPEARCIGIPARVGGTRERRGAEGPPTGGVGPGSPRSVSDPPGLPSRNVLPYTWCGERSVAVGGNEAA